MIDNTSLEENNMIHYKAALSDAIKVCNSRLLLVSADPSLFITSIRPRIM